MFNKISIIIIYGNVYGNGASVTFPISFTDSYFVTTGMNMTGWSNVNYTVGIYDATPSGCNFRMLMNGVAHGNMNTSYIAIGY